MVSFEDLIPQQPEQRPLTRGEQKKRDADKYMKNLGAGIAGAADTASFGFGDEMIAGLKSWPAYLTDKVDFNDLYSQNLAKGRADIAQTKEENPNAFLAGQVAGAIGTGVGGAATKGGAAIANSLRSGKVLGAELGLAGRMAKTGALGAATSGFAGAGAGEGFENRMESSRDSAVGGGIVGGLVPGLGAAAGKVIGKPIEKASNYIASKIAARTGEVPAAEASKSMQKVGQRLVADYKPEEIDRILNSYASTKDKSLLQIGGKRIANLAEGAAQYPSGGAKAAEYFDEAIGGAPEKLKGTIAKNISPNVNYYDTVDDIVASGRKQAAPLYQKAFQANQAVNSPVINRILQTPEGRAALGEAAKNMQNQMALVSKPDKELTALAKELGMASTGQGVGRGLKLQTLDEIKKAMDSTINKAYRSGDEAEARRIIALKQGIVSELDAADKTGLYAKARSVSGDYITNRKAAEEGVNFLREDPQVIARNFSQYGPTEKKAYKVGVLKSIRNDLDAKVDGQNIARLFNKSATREKLQAILTKSEFDNVMRDAKATDELYKLRNQIVGNSRTAGRQIAAEEFNNETGQLINELATKGTTRALLDRGVGIIARQFDGLGDKSAKEVAEILFETDPKKKYAIVRELSNLTKSKTNVIQATEAGKKLRAFYSLSDAIQTTKSGQLAAPAGMVTGGQSQSTALPASAPSVQPAALDFNDLIPQQGAGLMDRIKQAESGGNPNAKNPLSSASGLYQFTDATWRSAVDKFGRRSGLKYSDKNNPQAQEQMMAALTQDNAKILQNKGIEPTDGNLYFAHFMGAPAGAAAIKMLGTGAIAARSFPSAAKANPQVFFDGQRPRTVDEVYQLITSKVV